MIGYISVRAKGQERFIRLKAQTLGERYSVEGITKRIEKSRKRKPIIRDNRISLIIDIQNCIKAQESKGYEHWAKINNLKQASKTLNYLTEHNINSYSELESRIDETCKQFDDTADKFKSVERNLNDINILRKHISTYKALILYMINMSSRITRQSLKRNTNGKLFYLRLLINIYRRSRPIENYRRLKA